MYVIIKSKNKQLKIRESSQFHIFFFKNGSFFSIINSELRVKIILHIVQLHMYNVAIFKSAIIHIVHIKLKAKFTHGVEENLL